MRTQDRSSSTTNQVQSDSSLADIAIPNGSRNPTQKRYGNKSSDPEQENPEATMLLAKAMKGSASEAFFMSAGESRPIPGHKGMTAKLLATTSTMMRWLDFSGASFASLSIAGGGVFNYQGRLKLPEGMIIPYSIVITFGGLQMAGDKAGIEELIGPAINAAFSANGKFPILFPVTSSRGRAKSSVILPAGTISQAGGPFDPSSVDRRLLTDLEYAVDVYTEAPRGEGVWPFQ